MTAPTPVTTPPSRLARGHVDALPLIVGYLPFGLVLGATVGASSMRAWLGTATSPLVFAGAAQLAMVEVLDDGGTALAAIVAAIAINLRHLMYSADMAPWFRSAGPAWRWAAPALLNDPQYLLCSRRFPELPDDRSRRRYYLQLGVTLWTAWTTMTLAGVLLGGHLPTALPISVIVPLTFLALLVPSLADRPALAAAAVGGLVAVVAHGLPLHLGLLAGAIAGMAAGLHVERSHA